MCNNHNFTVRAYAYDAVTCLCLIDEDGIHIVEQGDEDVIDTSWFGNAICVECGCNVNVETEKILDKEIQLRPYTVLLSYPELDDRGNPETFFWWTHAHDDLEAVEAVRKVASEKNDGGIPPEDFFPLAVFRGHIDIE
jgi:hypothetical protein